MQCSIHELSMDNGHKSMLSYFAEVLLHQYTYNFETISALFVYLLHLLCELCAVCESQFSATVVTV